MSQSKLEADHDVADAMGGKTCASVGFGFGFTSDWIAKSCEFFKPIAGRRSANKRKHELLSALKRKSLSSIPLSREFVQPSASLG